MDNMQSLLVSLKIILAYLFGRYISFPTVMFLSFWANSVDPDQEQSDHGLHCLLVCLHI